MRKLGMTFSGGLAVAICLSAHISCRKRDSALKSDLSEAGYQLTAVDWFRASKADDAPAMKKFLRSGFSADTRDAAGNSALHAAAEAGAQTTADLLLDRGLPLEIINTEQRTPLMSAVTGGQPRMVAWLLRQGADPRHKDAEGFSSLMLAVREGQADAVAELASYSRENLDAAILLAALVGKTEVIDTLTNYGASVYARMDDGRTALMIAAQNGHTESVKLLLDIGAGRFSVTETGKTAADLAIAAGHQEVAALISGDPSPTELSLPTASELAKSMDTFVDAAAPISDAPSVASGLENQPTSSSNAPQPSAPRAAPSRPIQGQVLSAAVVTQSTPPSRPSKSDLQDQAKNKEKATTTETSTVKIKRMETTSLAMPPLVMRLYREREIPIQIRTVEGETATLGIGGASPRDVKIRAGENIPGSSLRVTHVQRRMQDSKLNLGQPMEVSVVQIHDTTTGATREWISGVPSTAHDPIALVEDSATGQRYTASPGQHFTSADGTPFIVTDVRPNQLVIENATTGIVKTIPLYGPRGKSTNTQNSPTP